VPSWFASIRHGIVDTVSALTDGPKTYSEAISRYFLARYVQVREATFIRTRHWTSTPRR